MASQEMETLKIGMKMMMERGFAPKFDGSLDPITLRTVIQAAQEQTPVNPGVRFDPCLLGSIEAELSVPQSAREEAVILYIHGGGFLCGNAVTSRSFAGMLAVESSFPVYSISYRLAPENPYPAALEDCVTAYRKVRESQPGKSVFLIGESAGACLSLATALKARDEGLELPDGLILYSPPIDLSGALNRHFPGNKDFTVTPDAVEWMAELYCGPQDRTDPLASPYYADYAGLCPIYIAWDESESLSVDAQVLRDKAMNAGVEVTWRSFPDCFHAFAATGRGTPESLAILNDSILFIENRLHRSGETQ